MNHSWPNVGHDALVRAVREAAEAHQDSGVVVRAISFDVRGAMQIPERGRFQLFVGTGGPGHLDPRLNDGTAEWSQGITENAAWEAPLFRLFDQIADDEDSALVAVCHT